MDVINHGLSLRMGNGIDTAKEGFNSVAEETGEMAEGWVEGWVEGWRKDRLRDGRAGAG